MKIFKNTKAKKDAKIAAAIKDFLTKFKLKEKIDLANQWADAHKKKVSVITISMLTAITIIGSWLTLTAPTTRPTSSRRWQDVEAGL
jgi:hypothetical protein